MKCKFSNPHPGGLAGCMKPLPTEVKAAIDKIVAEQSLPRPVYLTLGAAVRLVLLAAAVDARAGQLSGRVTLVEDVETPGTNMMMMQEDAGELFHIWRLLNYTELPESQQSGTPSSRG